MSHDEPVSPAPVVALVDERAPSERMARPFAREVEQRHRVRYLTRALAHSETAWAISMRAEQGFAGLTAVDPSLRAIVSLATSAWNQNPYCVDDGIGAARNAGWSTAEILDVCKGRLERFAPRLRVALEATRCLVVDRCSALPTAMDAELREHFRPEEIVEIVTVVALEMYWASLTAGLRVPVEGRCVDASIVATALSAARATDG